MTGESGEGKAAATRVLRVFSRLNIGGPSVHVILLTHGLRPLGYDTRLVVGRESAREGNLFALAEEKGVACETQAGLGREIAPLRDLVALAGLARLMRAWRPAIVHTHTAKAGLVGRLAARAAGVRPVVHTYHGHVLRGYFSPAKEALFRRLERLLARSTNALVAVSETVKQDLVQLGVAPAEKVRVIPLGLELSAFAGSLPRGALRREAGLDAETPLVGMVGRLVPVKDVPTFLKAALRVRVARPDVRFVLVGDGEERRALEALSGSLGLAGAVHFAGWRRDLAAVYADLDVVVNASRNEGTPVALIEALAAERPVVATAVGGTPDLLGRAERGLLVPPGEPEALARAILETLDAPEPALARARAGRAHALQAHSCERLFHEMDALYRELAPRSRQALPA